MMMNEVLIMICLTSSNTEKSNAKEDAITFSVSLETPQSRNTFKKRELFPITKCRNLIMLTVFLFLELTTFSAPKSSDTLRYPKSWVLINKQAAHVWPPSVCESQCSAGKK